MHNEEAAYLLSFLAILIQRAGGVLVIENLSKEANSLTTIQMELDKENDRVTLRSSMMKLDDHRFRDN